MQNKVMVLVITGVLAVVGIIGLNYESIKNDIKSVVDNGVVGPNQNSQDDIAEKSNLEEQDMIKIMEINGFSNIAEALEKKDYEAMDEFTNNMTDEDYEKLINLKANISAADYQKMLQIMSENGYDSMVSVMASIDLGGSCH
jgi:hypothetical protein